MQLAKVKIGEFYTSHDDFGTKFECVDITPVIPGRGRRIILQDADGEIEVEASSVIPWQEYQDKTQRDDIQKQEMDELIDKLSALSGGGIKSINQTPQWVTLVFAEHAAARILELLDAILIPKKDMPSLAAKGHKVRAQKALRRRLRRAYDVAASYNDGYHASLSFTIEELAEAVTLLKGRTNQTSALADMLATCN